MEPALDDADKRGLKPKELLADSHYGSNECLTKGRERGVEIISPAMTAKGKLQGKLTLEDFELDSEGRVLRCPAGKEPIETSVADVRIQVLFDPVGCEGCPHRDNCPAAAVGRSERRWQADRAQVCPGHPRDDADSRRAGHSIAIDQSLSCSSSESSLSTASGFIRRWRLSSESDSSAKSNLARESTIWEIAIDRGVELLFNAATAKCRSEFAPLTGLDAVTGMPTAVLLPFSSPAVRATVPAF